jgi:hypothetical protein
MGSISWLFWGSSQLHPAITVGSIPHVSSPSPKPLNALLHCVGDCAHYPPRFVIFAVLALLCHFAILIFRIIAIVGTCDITQTVPNSNHHHVKHLFRLLGRQSCIFRCHCIFLLLPNCWLWVFIWHSCPSGLALNIMPNR